MNSTLRATDAHIDTAEMLSLYQIGEADLENIRSFGDLIVPRLEDYVTHFYGWMETQPEFEQFFSDAQKLAKVQRQQLDYWREFFAAELDDAYFDKRRIVGEAHARIGLPLQTYLAAMNMSFKFVTETLYDGGLSDVAYAMKIRSVSKLMHMDTAIVAQTFTARINRIIAEQNDALMEMSTPVTAIWDGILLLPIVGIMDSKRAQDVMDTMLAKISETEATVMILDISGVGVVDTAVANHLIKMTKATKLMGCETIISGISPAIAQTVVELGIHVGEVVTTATLRDALLFAFQTMGVEMRQSA